MSQTSGGLENEVSQKAKEEVDFQAKEEVDRKAAAEEAARMEQEETDHKGETFLDDREASSNDENEDVSKKTILIASTVAGTVFVAPVVSGLIFMSQKFLAMNRYLNHTVELYRTYTQFSSSFGSNNRSGQQKKVCFAFEGSPFNSC
ncbi:hypothetical protein BGZ83_004781 [Gryganskiella cystojenkinii]|nr:hypothetical protein BGZ83_004781 [Gryganskiella cystojenkinii]